MADGERTAVQEAAENMDRGGILVRRWLGAWIDIIAVAVIFFGTAIGIQAITGGVQSPQNTNIAVGVTLFMCVAYFPFTEGIWGRTLGKLITGTIVVDKDGRGPGFGRALMRTVLRLIEVNPVLAGGVPAGICVLATKYKQRLGDLAAGTYVISAADLKRITETDAILADVRGKAAS